MYRRGRRWGDADLGDVYHGIAMAVDRTIWTVLSMEGHFLQPINRP